MRVQIQSLRQRGGVSAKDGKRDRPAAAGAAKQDTGSDDLALLAAERIRGIRADDPQKKQKAVRVFLESVLLSELGPALVNDPGFSRMVDHVQQQFQDDPQLAQAADQAAELLLQSAHG
ncbi:hypothetical protein [Ramlibacter sp.]|uniref:hypothetical protein n=1 Tax=Ramlibacter sp. TaxID=1917967 RepID=UPI0017C8EB27|nr:hypothetical protein [Ramlibacter sp.]MBA2673918.1 hypothetical protein [Ramlibacter sp.]